MIQNSSRPSTSIKWLSSKEAAEYLRLTPNALRIMVHREQIKTYKVGNRLRFKLNDLKILIKEKYAN